MRKGKIDKLNGEKYFEAHEFVAKDWRSNCEEEGNHSKDSWEYNYDIVEVFHRVEGQLIVDTCWLYRKLYSWSCEQRIIKANGQVLLSLLDRFRIGNRHNKLAITVSRLDHLVRNAGGDQLREIHQIKRRVIRRESDV